MLTILTRNPIVPVAFFLSALFLFPSSATAQTGPTPDEARRHGIFLETIDVSLVNVEVVVTDKSGNPVKNLTVDDFEITDDGRPVEITNFYRVEGGHRALAPSELEGSGQEAEVELAEDFEPFSVIVLLDDIFITAQSRSRIFKALRAQLDEIMADGTQVMVARIDPEVQIEQRFSKDRAKVDATLERLENVRRSPLSVDNEETALLRDLGRSVVPGALSAEGSDTNVDEYVGRSEAIRLLSFVRNHIREVHFKVSRSTEVVGAFLGSLAGMPGRKALIYVCDQMPIRPGERPMVTWWEKYGELFGEELDVYSVDGEVRPYDTSQQLHDLIADASASRVVFYPVGAGLSERLIAVTAEAHSDFTTGSFTNEVTYPPEEGLRVLALGTGGEASIQVANPKKILTRMRNDLTHYYSLAYASPHAGDGKRHEVKVKVKRPGLDVRYLESYRDKDKDQEMEDRTLSALLFDTVDNPLGVRVMVGEAQKETKKRYLVPIHVRLPVKNLVLLPQDKAHVGRVSVFIVARDEEGRMSRPQKVVVPIAIPTKALEEAMKRGATYSTRIAVRRGEQTIAVGVRDEIGAMSSTVPVYLDVGTDGKKNKKG